MHKYRNVFVCMHAHVYSPTDSRYTHTEVNVSTYMVQDIFRTCYMYPFFFSRIKRGGCVRVRGEQRFVESWTLLSQRLNARGGEGVGKGGVWV